MCYSIFFREGNKIHTERSSVEVAKIEVSKSVFFWKDFERRDQFYEKIPRKWLIRINFIFKSLSFPNFWHMKYQKADNNIKTAVTSTDISSKHVVFLKLTT